MPTYDYECRSCGNRIEIIHAMSDPGPAACERCGGQMRRLLHPAGIIFKGSGFYKTDSRTGSTRDAPTGGSSAASRPPGSPDTGSKGDASPSSTTPTSSGSTTAPDAG